MRNKLVVVLFGAVALAACAAEPDYYEGEVVHTRPISKPSLDPTQPAELTGSTEPSDIPPINESKVPGQQIQPGGDHLDGRIAWAEEVTKQDGSYTYLHDVDSWTGVDTVTVLDQYGSEIGRYTTKFSPTPSNISVTR